MRNNKRYTVKVRTYTCEECLYECPESCAVCNERGEVWETVEDKEYKG